MAGGQFHRSSGRRDAPRAVDRRPPRAPARTSDDGRARQDRLPSFGPPHAPKLAYIVRGSLEYLREERVSTSRKWLLVGLVLFAVAAAGAGLFLAFYQVRTITEYRDPKIKSDGKSGAYYDIVLPERSWTWADERVHGEGNTIQFTAADIMEHVLDNDYDRSSIFKALVRIGKKEGIDHEYDLNKISYHLERLRKRFCSDTP